MEQNPRMRMDLYNILNSVALVISLITFLVDIFSDYMLVITYGLTGFLDWCLLTLTFAFMPSIVTMVFSMHWYKSEDMLGSGNFLIHILQLGLLYRYIHLIISGWIYSKREQYNEDEYNQKLSDVCLLRIFEAFLESAPQLVLQLYVMMSYDNYSVWTSITALSSVISLGWGIVAYTKSQRCSRPDKKKLSIIGITLQTAWRISLISARVLSLALAATVLSYWLILFLAVHFVCMLCWVIYQKTGFSKLMWEEYLFNFVMAFVYCFCFFNLKESRSRWRMIAFYTVIICENCGLLVFYIFYSHHALWQIIAGFMLVFGLTIVGLTCMMLYYSRFHPIGHIKFTIQQAETGNMPQSAVMVVQPIRRMKKSKSICLVPRRPTSNSLNNTKNSAMTSSSDPGVTSLHCPKHLPSISVCKKRETLCSIQDLLENMSSLEDLQDDPVHSLQSDTSKIDELEDKHDTEGEDGEVGFCLSQNEIGIPLIKTTCVSEINLADTISDTKISDVTDTDSNVTVIPGVADCLLECSGNNSSSTECNNDYENIYDAITLDVDAAPTLAKRACALKLSETLDTFVSSTHDYENVAPVNIHRDVMRIRHWKPYFDIGDRIHDYSTYKDKSKLTEMTNSLDYSRLRDREAALTVSMPDLNLDLEEKNYAVPYMQTNPMLRFTSLDDLSNYETIWVESSCEDVERPIKSGHSSLVATINNVRAKENLSHLYHSSFTDFSCEKLLREKSDLAQKPVKEIYNTDVNDTPDKKIMLLRTPKSARSRCKRTFSILLDKIDASQWASLRTPVKRQISIHKTAKALQAGIRVFHRPRVHTITPKKESKEALRWDQNIRIKRSPSSYVGAIWESTHGPIFNSNAEVLGEPINEPIIIPNLSGHNNENKLQQREPCFDSTDSGPKHSTPETSRHAPQVSVLSGLSSVVASPEDAFVSRTISGMESELSLRRPLGENKNILNYHLSSVLKPSNDLFQLKASESLNCHLHDINSYSPENIRERQIM